MGKAEVSGLRGGVRLRTFLGKSVAGGCSSANSLKASPGAVCAWGGGVTGRSGTGAFRSTEGLDGVSCAACDVLQGFVGTAVCLCPQAVCVHNCGTCGGPEVRREKGGTRVAGCWVCVDVACE